MVGSYLLRYLIEEGYTNIRALRRPTSKMDLVAPVADQIEWVEGDILDIPSLEEAFQDIEQVYHCAALISFDPNDRKQMMVVNGEGTANVVNVALANNVEKFIHTSSIAAIGRPKIGATISEATSWERSKYNSNYAISKYLAEQEVWRGWAEGLQVGVVNPAIILGGGRWDEGPLKLFKLAWKEFPFYPAGSSGFVDVRDVARFMIQLMESDINGQRYLLSSTNSAIREVMNSIAYHAKKKKPWLKVTPFIQQIAWRIEWIRARFFGASPLITRETAAHSSRLFFYDNKKSIETFDFDYIPLEETLSETTQLFQQAAQQDFAPRLLPLR
jgi:dihydroflavonol-4-reductase